MRFHEIMAEAPKRRAASEPPKRRAASEPPKPSPIRLEYGRSVMPRPKRVRWQHVGDPVMMNLTDLDLHPDGLATASSAWQADFDHTNTKPVAVTMYRGKYHVLDGYHRVVNAAQRGERQILVQICR
jgi:hypothetical protein